MAGSGETVRGSDRLVAVVLDDQRYAFHLSVVDRVVRAVEITHLPGAPGIVAGVANVQGRIIPVLDIRRRFGLPERKMTVGDQLVIANTSRRRVALIVDAATGVLEISGNTAVGARDVLPDLSYVEGVVKLDDGLILIHDLDRFLSLDEETVLDRALESS
jgi:purine-binding chemotaxis protein CheW